jgi:hypothetical protein
MANPASARGASISALVIIRNRTLKRIGSIQRPWLIAGTGIPGVNPSRLLAKMRKHKQFRSDTRLVRARMSQTRDREHGFHRMLNRQFVMRSFRSTLIWVRIAIQK